MNGILQTSMTVYGKQGFIIGIVVTGKYGYYQLEVRYRDAWDCFVYERSPG